MSTVIGISPGRVLADRYRIERMAGEGGMAIVFEATDLKHSRRVAIKVLRPEIATNVGHERFRREIEVLAGLSHPNIVPLYESGESDGLVFYVMPFVTGETLKDRMDREHPLPVDETLRITREVAKALEYAHAAGIVHRDLKPANIMLSGGVAVVSDFGIARVVNNVAHEQLTYTGIAIGTPAYMSPEQAMGDAEVTARSDQYSLACVVYEMLTGERPFQGKTPLATLALQTSTPAPDVRERRRETPPEVAEALKIALSKHAEQRFASVEEFTRHLGGGSTSTAPRTPAVPSTGRLRWVAAAVIVLAVAVGGWFVAQRSRGGSAATPPVVAVLTFDHQGPPSEKYLTDGITDELSSRIAEVNGIRVVSRASAMQYDLRKQSLRDIANQLQVTHVLVGSVRTDRRADGTQLILVTPRLVSVATGRDLWSDQITAAAAAGEVFGVQERIAKSVARALDVALSPEATATLASLPTTDMQAYLAFLRGNLHATQFLVRGEQEQAIADLQEAVRLDPNFAIAHARLAQVQGLFISVFGKTPERLADFKASVDRAMALEPDLPQTRIALGMWYNWGVGDRDRSLKEFEAMRARQPNNADLFVQIGRAYRSAGDNNKAFAAFQRATEIDPRSTADLFEAGVALFLLHRMTEGTQFMERALAINPEWLPARIGITQFQLFEGKADEVKRRMAEMADVPGLVTQLIGDPLYRFRWEVGLPPVYDERLDRLTLAEARVDSAEFYRAKGRHYARQGDQRRERAYFDTLLTVLEARRRTGSVNSFTHVDLGFAYAVLGRSAEARAYADSAHMLGGLKNDAFRGWFASWEIARLYARLGARDEALAVLKEVDAPRFPAFVRLDPAFATLRDDPRLAAMLKGGA